MPLVDQTEMFSRARSERYALGSFNVVSLEMAYGVVGAAEESQSPVIVAVTDGHAEYYKFEALTAGLREIANSASVPVGLHFDHGMTLGSVSRALRAGFTSVMYDGSGSPWETFLVETRVVTEMAHGVGALVEAALSADSRELTANPTGRWELPDDALVAEFLDATAVDILAIGEGSSVLDPERVSNIALATSAHVSLHGGSQLDNPAVASMIDSGLAKCSVYSAVSKEAIAASRDYLSREGGNVLELGSSIKEGFSTGVKKQLTRFQSTDRA